MNSNLMPFVILGIFLLLAVLTLAVWRRVVASHEDDTLHVLHSSAVPHQVAVSHRLDVIDKWGQLMTVVAAVYILILLAVYMYRYWVSSGSFNW